MTDTTEREAEAKPKKATKPKPKSDTLPRPIVEALPAALRAAVALREFQDAVAQMADEIQAHTTTPIQLARAFVAARRTKDVMEDSTKLFNSFFEPLKSEIVPRAFENAGIPNVTLDEGFRVGVSGALYASIRKDKQTMAYEWLRNNGLGDLITETVNASTLSATARSMMEDENRELPESLFTIMMRENTSVTKTS